MLGLKRLWSVFVILATVAMGAGGCSKSGGAEPVTEAGSAPPVLARAPATASRVFGAGDAAQGEKLVAHHQCNRCHEGTGEGVPAREVHCVNCHREILNDEFPAPAAKLAAWKPNVAPVRAVPSLTSIGERLRRDWIVGFLLAPHDLRPMLVPTMPRLNLSEADARDIATFLTVGARTEPAAQIVSGDPEQGRRLMEQRGCGGCHAFSGVPVFSATPSRERAVDRDAILLAPDLRYVRDRYTEVSLKRWLTDPRAVKPDTLMPPTGLDAREVQDVAAYLLRARLEPREKPPAFQRKPVLERAVTFAEVDEQVFRKICRHCHGDPNVARGDGGPGNTGGFGFERRSIDLSSYRAIASGYLGKDGRRHSLFEETEGGVPRLLAALLARHDEEAGSARTSVRGMPLGMPALSSDAIQLVESWIAQGRPR